MRILAVALMASLTAAAQTLQTKAPTHTTTTHVAPHCEDGWHLERWYEREFPDADGVVSRYVPIWYIGNHDFSESKKHPDRCVKDEPKAKR